MRIRFCSFFASCEICGAGRTWQNTGAEWYLSGNLFVVSSATAATASSCLETKKFFVIISRINAGGAARRLDLDKRSCFFVFLRQFPTNKWRLNSQRACLNVNVVALSAAVGAGT